MVQVVYMSHGGGPLPILGDPGHVSMVEFMKALPARLRRPESILVVSAHWEEDVPTLLGADSPRLFYDYYGFPEQAYELEYPAPGAPALAKQVAGLLDQQGIAARIDYERGFDHGLFIPLKLMYPEADIPCTQLSLIRGLDAASHLALGAALRGLRDQELLVVGSGFSFHNMGAFYWSEGSAVDARNDAFQDWLLGTCAEPLPREERLRRLTDWTAAPSARYCHPREEHLLPLHVCMGLADRPGKVVFDDRILGKRSLALLWD